MKNKLLPLQIFSLSTFVVSILFIWQGNIGFNLWDEGFLWYGAQRVILGEVPIRDFMAYDPGRYYWSATLMSLWGDSGIMALRGSVAIFQTIGLSVGILLVARTVQKQNFLYLLLVSITLVVWMYPRHKLFDISLSILLIGVLTFLIKNPTCKRYFIAGLCVGLVAVFGRNHGVYGAVGSLGVLLWLNFWRESEPSLIKACMLWVFGVTTGFMPILIMLLFVPDFASAFWIDLYSIFVRGSTNLPLPIPWPWLVDFTSVAIGEAAREILIGLFFIAVLVFSLMSGIHVVCQKIEKKKVPSALVASTFLALPYAHYAYSRADVAHLAQGVFPLLVGSLVFLGTKPVRVKWPLVLVLCSVSLWVMHVFHPGWQYHTSKQYVNVKISGSDMLVKLETATDVGLLRNLADQYSPQNQSFIAAPFWPGAYSLLGRKSPMWDIYALFPRSPAFEQAEIERIIKARPGFALIYDLPLDGRDELRFLNTHPLIHQYILDNFEILPNSPNPAYQIYKDKEITR